jgi:hypothetical protein
MLGRNPGFAAVAALTLALGFGANTAVFGVVNAALLGALPYAEPERIVTIYYHPSPHCAWKRAFHLFQSREPGLLSDDGDASPRRAAVQRGGWSQGAIGGDHRGAYCQLHTGAARNEG